MSALNGGGAAVLCLERLDTQLLYSYRTVVVFRINKLSRGLVACAVLCNCVLRERDRRKEKERVGVGRGERVSV